MTAAKILTAPQVPVHNGTLVPLMPVKGVEYEGGDRRWRYRDGKWEMFGRRGPSHDWFRSSYGDHLWRTGQLRPVPSQPWTPKEGEWVQHRLQPWGKARQVNGVSNDEWTGELVVHTHTDKMQWCATELRPATPEEIEAAKRIEVKDRLIVRYKADGGVWRYNVEPLCWSRLDCYGYRDGLEYLDLDHYDILPEYTVQGATSHWNMEMR